MITAEQLTRRVLVDSLYSRVCPACGDRKGEQKTFCYSCFCSLPSQLKAATYNRVGKGYEKAVLDCMNQLKAEKVHTEEPA